MSGFTERIARLSPAKRALLALEMGDRAEPDPAGAEPIAIIGMGCRFPGGVEDPDGFWRLLHTGTDGIVKVPANRWDIDRYYDPDPDAPGKMSTRWGGFLQGIDYFDTRFFGISPREAAWMDPQQRLLLEVTWEALEAAGQAPDRLAGSDTGVFVGISTNDYAMLQLKHGAIKLIDAYAGTGSSASVASGRLSYLLGLQGPCISVDTACSSSLVAVHLACQSLRTGECRLALAGGVNVILSPEVTINFSKARMMAADGRCKTFDAAADGYVRGEGCGMVVLKRYTDAVASGDDILAVIPGSAVNQDGRSGGLTVPNGPAQESVIRRALKNAGIKPDQVSYIEAHGTGTSLGDPIEIGALGAVFGSDRNGHGRLNVGSVKTNIGHLEAAAGIAGLIKVVLALRRAEIPPHLH
ncbi:MAG TPA: polyketide synthase, partial [Opitutaceae bacterium]|nr:polyketide synthase [Opitutaceae bacterium]